jgi:hypothetical protein
MTAVGASRIYIFCRHPSFGRVKVTHRPSLSYHLWRDFFTSPPHFHEIDTISLIGNRLGIRVYEIMLFVKIRFIVGARAAAGKEEMKENDIFMVVVVIFITKLTKCTSCTKKKKRKEKVSGYIY